MNAPQDKQTFRLVGTRPVRPDGDDKVTGKAKQATKDVAGTGGGFAWSGASKEIDISAIGPIDTFWGSKEALDETQALGCTPGSKSRGGGPK